MKKQPTTSAEKILHQRIYKDNPHRMADYEQTCREMELGLKIRRLRREAGLTQAQLAERIGTQPSAVSRLEDADYDRHSIQTLAKAADALGMRLIVDFEPKSTAKAS